MVTCRHSYLSRECERESERVCVCVRERERECVCERERAPTHRTVKIGERMVTCRHSYLENNYSTEMCSSSEAGSYLRLIDFCITQL